MSLQSTKESLVTVTTRPRRFKHYPLIHIDPEKCWGNPTLVGTRLTIFKIWEMVTAHEMDALIESEPALTLGEINSVMEFVDWCLGLGLMTATNSGRLTYDKDALYQAAKLECPPRGKLCLYCLGFLPRGSHAWTEVRESQRGSEDVREGVAHGACIQAVMLNEPVPDANVLR